MFCLYCPKSPNSNARSARDGNIAGHSANENLSVPVRSVKIGSNLVKFDLQSLFSNEMFELSNVVTNSAWQDDVETLPHRQDLNSFSHFEDVELYELPDNDTVDLLIGNDNSFLMTVLEGRVGVSRCEPHAVLTPLGWLACGGKSPLEEQNVKVC